MNLTFQLESDDDKIDSAREKDTDTDCTENYSDEQKETKMAKLAFTKEHSNQSRGDDLSKYAHLPSEYTPRTYRKRNNKRKFIKPAHLQAKDLSKLNDLVPKPDELKNHLTGQLIEIRKTANKVIQRNKMLNKPRLRLKFEKYPSRFVPSNKQRSKRDNYCKKVKLKIDEDLCTKINKALDQMHQSGSVQNIIHHLETCALKLPNCQVIERSQYERHVMAFMVPNDFSTSNFGSLEGKDGWHYESNEKQTLKKLPGRMSGKIADYYQSLVKREGFNKEGILIREALCPYCPVNFDNLNLCFYNLAGSNYLHHVVKNHGVWSTGKEMPPPVLYETNLGTFITCGFCNHHPKMKFKSDISERDRIIDSQFVGYYRHIMQYHNITQRGKVGSIQFNMKQIG